MEKIIDANGDEFIRENDEWFWIDLEGEKEGPFKTKEEARADAHKHWWWNTEKKCECCEARPVRRGSNVCEACARVLESRV